MVQIGIWDSITLEATDGAEIAELHCVADADLEAGTGLLRVTGRMAAGGLRVAQASGGSDRSDESDRSDRLRALHATITLSRDGQVIRSETLSAAVFNTVGVSWRDLAVELWQPNGQGEQPLYTVTVTLCDGEGREHDRETRRVGFRHIAWRACEGAPEGADPWVCVVNGQPIFLQGVNCPPMLPNFADTLLETYRQRLTLYRDLGVNTLRVNGVGFLEKEAFYDLCDEWDC